MNECFNYAQQPQMGYYQQPNYGYYNYPYGSYQPQVVNQPLVMNNVNALNDEEIRILENSRPKTLSINIDQNDVYRSICTHKKNGRDVVQRLSDGSGDVWCPICNARWKPQMIDNDELETIIKTLDDQMQNAKWIGDLPIELTRELFTMEPMIKQYPKIHKYAIENFRKYFNQNAIINAADSSSQAQYNSLFGPGNGIGYANPGYYQQQYMPAQPQQPDIYYGQQMGMPPVNGNPCVNPMQATMPYGVNPMAPNQQFVNQAANMMPPQQPGYNGVQPQQQPGYNGVQPQQPVTAQPAQPQTATFATPQPQAYQPQNPEKKENATVSI